MARYDPREDYSEQAKRSAKAEEEKNCSLYCSFSINNSRAKGSHYYWIIGILSLIVHLLIAKFYVVNPDYKKGFVTMGIAFLFMWPLFLLVYAVIGIVVFLMWAVGVPIENIFQ